MSSGEGLCNDCPRRSTCKEACGRLQEALKAVEHGYFSGPLWDPALIERVCGVDIDGTDGLSRMDMLRRRGAAMKRLIELITEITNDDGYSLRLFFILMLVGVEKLKHWEVGEMFGLSRGRVSQIVCVAKNWTVE